MMSAAMCAGPVLLTISRGESDTSPQNDRPEFGIFRNAEKAGKAG